MQLKKKIIGRSLLAILAIAIALPSMAHNRVPSITYAPSIDRYEVDDRRSDERELVVIDRATLRHFDDVSRIELPPEPIASQLETRIRSITFTADHASLDVFPVRQKLASGLFALRDENNVNDASDLARKTWWAIEFQALPFNEPATGLIYARARWYDPSTGSFLTPDPLGYQDSSNLYAFAGGDPVNGRDPSGLWELSTALTSAYHAAAKEALNPQNSGAARVTLGVLALLAAPAAGAEQVLNGVVDTPGRIWRSSSGVTQETMAAIAAKNTDSRLRHAAAALGNGSQLVLDATVVEGAVESALVRHAEKSLLKATTTRTVATTEAGEAGETVAAQGRTRFDATNLTAEQVDKAILKSIRRKSGATGTSTGEIAATADQSEFMLQKVTSWRRDVHAANANLSALPANLKGTLLHSSVQSRISQLNISDLAVNERLYGTSQFISPNTGLPYAYRIPDFRSPTTIFDIKPIGTPLSGSQYIDFMQFSGLSDVRWIYYTPY